MVIKYEIKLISKLCITPCPHKEKMGESIIKVGSGFCEACDFFKHRNAGKQTVVCNHPGKEGNDGD